MRFRRAGRSTGLAGSSWLVDAIAIAPLKFAAIVAAADCFKNSRRGIMDVSPKSWKTVTELSLGKCLISYAISFDCIRQLLHNSGFPKIHECGAGHGIEAG